MPDRLPGPPRARMFAHPGPVNPVRIESLHSRSARHYRLALASGTTLYDGVVQALSAVQIRSAALALWGGDLQSLRYCVGRADDSRRRVAVYSEPRTALHARVLSGNATLGLGADGAPVVHCHAVFAAADGTVCGGHLLTEQCLVGREPVTLLVTTLDDFDLRLQADEETGMSLMRPCAMEKTDA